MSRTTVSSIAAMHPWRTREPFHREGWVYERKEDGWRMLTLKDGGRVRLVSRHGVDHTGRFPHLAAAMRLDTHATAGHCPTPHPTAPRRVYASHLRS